MKMLMTEAEAQAKYKSGFGGKKYFRKLVTMPEMSFESGYAPQIEQTLGAVVKSNMGGMTTRNPWGMRRGK